MYLMTCCKITRPRRQQKESHRLHDTSLLHNLKALQGNTLKIMKKTPRQRSAQKMIQMPKTAQTNLHETRVCRTLRFACAWTCNLIFQRRRAETPRSHLTTCPPPYIIPRTVSSHTPPATGTSSQEIIMKCNHETP